MCGRYALRITLPELAQILGIATPKALHWQPRYNIAPTEQVPFLRAGPDNAVQITQGRWGLVPSWSRGPDSRYAMFNARLEGITDKPAYRTPIRRRRCAIPADGWYEWQSVNGAKQPYLLHTANHGPVLLAGIWDRWRGQDGEALDSCAIVTTAASAAPQTVHTRMPVMLANAQLRHWLDPMQVDAGRALALLDPEADAKAIVATAVGRYVNNARNQGPQCVAALAGENDPR